ncbi:hypothetical protein HDU67_001016, partial [Dinochytrium kinnereticum]
MANLKQMLLSVVRVSCLNPIETISFCILLNSLLYFSLIHQFWAISPVSVEESVIARVAIAGDRVIPLDKEGDVLLQSAERVFVKQVIVQLPRHTAASPVGVLYHKILQASTELEKAILETNANDGVSQRNFTYRDACFPGLGSTYSTAIFENGCVHLSPLSFWSSSTKNIAADEDIRATITRKLKEAGERGETVLVRDSFGGKMAIDESGSVQTADELVFTFFLDKNTTSKASMVQAWDKAIDMLRTPDFYPSLMAGSSQFQNSKKTAGFVAYVKMVFQEFFE